VASSPGSHDASRHHEHHTPHCEDCAFCRARAKKIAEQLNAPFVPIHKRADYTVQPPDILTIDVSGIEDAPEDNNQPIHGEHLVHADGHVDLKSWGKLNVAGKTTAEIKSAIEELVDAANTGRSASVSVQAQNSRVYYIVDDSAGLGDTVKRVPYFGNETVLDAITSVGPLNEMGRRQIFISRPKPGAERVTSEFRPQPDDKPLPNTTETAIPVRWQWTSPTTVVITNPLLQPGDRIFITRPPSWVTFIDDAKNAAKVRQAQNAPPRPSTPK
jgi:protein involved in polysaccharide export with SLBB domain